jgi:hypothetical protein
MKTINKCNEGALARELANEHAEKTWGPDERWGGISPANKDVCRADFLAGYEAALDVIWSLAFADRSKAPTRMQVRVSSLDKEMEE